MNTLVVGMTQSGKSTAELNRIIDWDGAQVILDPHNSLAKKYLQWVACNDDESNIVYDDLTRTDKVLSWNFIERSEKAGSAGERENENRVRVFADILCRRRGLDITKTPLIEEWTLAALDLWLHQDPPKPLLLLPWAFRPRIGKRLHPIFHKLLSDCDHIVYEKFRHLHGLSPSAIDGKVAPAQRLVEATILSVGFKLRCNGGFDYKTHLDNGGVIVVGGDRENKNTTRVVLSSILQLVMQYVRAGGQPVRVVIDEAKNYEMIGQSEVESLAEDLKIGLSYSILTQSMNFLPDIRVGIMDNCGRKEWFRCSDMTAEVAGKDIGTVSIDPAKIKATEKRTRQVHDGYDYEESRSKQIGADGAKRSETETEQARARYRDVEEEINIYEAYNEQIVRKQQDIMGLDTGERYVREGKNAWIEYVEPVEIHPWEEVAEESGNELMERLIGEKGITPCLPPSTPIPLPSRKPSKQGSSRTTKRLGQDSRDSKSGNAVDPFE